MINYQQISTNRLPLEWSVHFLIRRYFVFKNRTRNGASTAVWSDPTDRFRAWSIDERESLVDRSSGRNFAHCIAIVTRNDLECIQQMTACIQAVDYRKKELHSCSTDQERLDFLYQSVERDFLHSRPCYDLRCRLKRFWIGCAMRSIAARRRWELSVRKESNNHWWAGVSVLVVNILPASAAFSTDKWNKSPLRFLGPPCK